MSSTIVINAAGCGSAMKRYGHLLRERSGVRRVGQGIRGEMSRHVRSAGRTRAARASRPDRHACGVSRRVSFAACTGSRVPPRQLLQGIPGVELREIAESEICCGSAGIYNMLEPEAATQLRDRKVANILRTEPDVLVSSNPGCLLQIATGFERAGRHVPVMHLIELLDRSITAARQTSSMR